MAYLLSLISTETSSPEAPLILFYYINKSNDIQIIRAISGATCDFERVMFSRERLLFTALPESYLEIYSSRIHGARLRKIDCKRLHIHGKPGKNVLLSIHPQMEYEINLSNLTKFEKVKQSESIFNS